MQALDLLIACHYHSPSCPGDIVTSSGRKTLTVRLTPEEKAQAEAVARYLNLPVTTFIKYAAKEAFNARLAELREAGLWPRASESDTEREEP
ncbi:MAG: hypothetical protein ACE5JX_19085 [Acidobacteriota bacterium]